jgi:hypothetical protein
MNTEKDFLSLLSTLAQEQQFTSTFPRQTTDVHVTFRSLTTAQLKDLVRTAVDSPLTQSVFNSTASRIFKESVLSASADIQLNTLDRLMFLLETRIQTISSTKKIKTNENEVEIDYINILKSLTEKVKSNGELFAPMSFNANNITVICGVPLIDTEIQLEDEVYKNVEIKIDNPEELRKFVGEAFINEIAKSIDTVSIETKTIETAKIPFKDRLKIIEMLPASLIQKVIDYIEAYKAVINKCLTIGEYTVPIDSTLFSA